MIESKSETFFGHVNPLIPPWIGIITELRSRADELKHFQHRRIGRDFLTGDSLEEVCMFLGLERIHLSTHRVIHEREVDLRLFVWFCHSSCVQHIVERIRATDMLPVRVERGWMKYDLCIGFGIKPPVCGARQGSGQ
jgi:hypothetical protein